MHTNIHDKNVSESLLLIVPADYAWWPATFLVRNSWNTEEELNSLGEKNVPLLISHGIVDEIIPVRHGKHLLDTYKGSNKVR